ncbi:response regulator [Sphingomonas sp. DBB INV C78]|uniref:response regulator transcription factor n=1 Tax=Sphingomonas sp. DBB INV C78 TaxID=3349434 RepID=UPI0036D3DB9F
MSRIPTVAIVDDDEAIRDALSDLLMLEGFDCRSFEGASAFLAEIGRTPFDCLITDMRMPGMSGLELLEHLHDRGADLPAIVLTSVVDEHSRARSLALGARAWLGKPVADKVLLNELRLAIQGRDVILPEGSAE